MGKLITKEDGYEIRLGQKNPTCYPCCFEGSVCDSPAFYANASPDVVRNYYMKVVKNQWWS